MDQELPSIEWTEVSGCRLAKSDYAQHRVACRIGNRNGIRKLLGCVDSVAMTYRDIRRAHRAWDLPCGGRGRDEFRCQREHECRTGGAQGVNP
jgi:hypothetical protein